MSQHHGHGGQHDHDKHDHSHAPARKGVHKDWRVWVIVGLMLLGMLIYILTLDESLQPVGR